MANGQQQKSRAPKLMNSETSGFDVSLRRIPSVGDMFYKIGNKGGVEFYTVVSLGRYRQTGSAGKGTLVYWRSENDGKLFVSAVRKARLFPLVWKECADEYADEEMHTELAQHIGVAKKPAVKVKKNYQVGDKAKLTILPKNTRAQNVVEKYVTMTLAFVHPNQDVRYWQDEKGDAYWGRKGSKEVRAFPTKRDLQEWINDHRTR